MAGGPGHGIRKITREGRLLSVSQLALSGIIKRFGGVTALDGIDLAVEEGEFFCLLGPSAAG